MFVALKYGRSDILCISLVAKLRYFTQKKRIKKLSL